MIDLSAQGFPDEAPLAISPGGAVATPAYWYQLGNPASVVVMPASPQGFYPPGTYPTAINDAGDQARFLVSTSSQNLVYLFRFHHAGTWQQISFTGNGTLSTYGVGSINAAGDVSATVLGTAQIAYGPDGLTQPLSGLLSVAYPGATVTGGGPMNSAGNRPLDKDAREWRTRRAQWLLGGVERHRDDYLGRLHHRQRSEQRRALQPADR